MKKLLIALFFTPLLFAQTFQTQAFATGLTQPVDVAHAGDSRLFVVQQNGRVRIVNSNGTVNATDFLNVSTLTTSNGERGLLGIAFHPNYSVNGYFYINYTRTSDGATVIARYTRSSTNPDVADSTSASIIMIITQDFSNHNGGCLRFGPDGLLYIGMGDGGSGGDPNNRAQNINSLLGKMLRIDVDNGTPYSSPATNPYAGATAGADEIFFTGMRNPWKFSFDKLNGNMWIADVGQNATEEINRVNAPLTPGLNMGWRCYEGNTAYNTTGCGAAANYYFPIVTYPLGSGNCSVVGGYVYRGTNHPSFSGKYIFADYCTGRIGYIDAVNGGAITWTTSQIANFLATFGEDVNGELYVASRSGGTLLKLIDPLSVNDNQLSKASVYPNPVDGILTIKSAQSNDISQIALIDMSGKSMQINSSRFENDILIDTSSLTNGIYLLQLTTSNGVEHHKIVKK
jgi:glucose/arabinose dehydrogenase